jgi:hypothetical protein
LLLVISLHLSFSLLSHFSNSHLFLSFSMAIWNWFVISLNQIRCLLRR